MDKPVFALVLCWKCDDETRHRLTPYGWVCDNCGEVNANELDDVAPWDWEEETENERS